MSYKKNLPQQIPVTVIKSNRVRVISTKSVKLIALYTKQKLTTNVQDTNPNVSE